LSSRGTSSDSTSAIIFSKDRPLQLHALLSSFCFHVRGISDLYILYHCSTEEYGDAYKKLVSQFSEFTFVRESSFHNDTLGLLNRIRGRKLFFLVDDIIFIDEFNVAAIQNIDLRSYVVSLRLHPKVTYSYMLKRSEKPPHFSQKYDSLLEFDWSLGEVDWAYPLSVDGHIFEALEIRRLIKRSRFYAPNSLEASLQRFTKKIAIRKKGLCFTTPKIINFPINRVQTEYNNAAGNTDPREFLRLFNEGFRVDFLRYQGQIFNAVHVETDLPLVKR